MKVIGFRSSPQCVRYAVVDLQSGQLQGALLNASGESRLVYPAGSDALDGRLLWLSAEIDRIIHKTPVPDKVIIKANEYGQENKAKRASIASDAVIMLCCAKANISVEAKIYAKLGTTSSKVEEHAENRVSRTDKYWDKQMADAVVAAWSGRE